MVLPFFAPSERPHAKKRAHVFAVFSRTHMLFICLEGLDTVNTVDTVDTHLEHVVHSGGQQAGGQQASLHCCHFTAVQLRRSANSQSMQCSQHSVDTGSRLASSLSCCRSSHRLRLRLGRYGPIFQLRLRLGRYGPIFQLRLRLQLPSSRR